MPHQPPRWIVSLIALGVVVGGAIAASGADGDDPVLEDPVPTTLVTTTTVADDVGDDAPEGDEPTDGDAAGTERYWGEECGDGEPTNHGQYVASSERTGESRREAAQSPCGKPLHSVNVTTTTTAPEVTTEGDDAPASPPTARGNGNGNGNAGGNGKAKGGPKKG